MLGTGPVAGSRSSFVGLSVSRVCAMLPISAGQNWEHLWAFNPGGGREWLSFRLWSSLCSEHCTRQGTAAGDLAFGHLSEPKKCWELAWGHCYTQPSDGTERCAVCSGLKSEQCREGRFGSNQMPSGCRLASARIAHDEHYSEVLPPNNDTFPPPLVGSTSQCVYPHSLTTHIYLLGALVGCLIGTRASFQAEAELSAGAACGQDGAVLPPQQWNLQMKRKHDGAGWPQPRDTEGTAPAMWGTPCSYVLEPVLGAAAHDGCCIVS